MRTYYVYGLGKSGLSLLKFLLQMGQKIIAWDDNLSFEQLGIIQSDLLTFEKLKSMADIDILCPSPGIPFLNPYPSDLAKMALKANLEVRSDVEIFQNFFPRPKYIGITGTNGKSTTTALINHIFLNSNINSAMGGNIGIPVCDLPKTDDPAFMYVIELSSYMLELAMKIELDVAICLNISNDHQDRYKTFENYVSAKTKIFEHSQKNVISIDCQTNKKLVDIYENIYKQTNIIKISANEILDNGVSVVNGVLHDNCYHNTQIDLNGKHNLFGKHNDENIAAAYAACIKYIKDPNKFVKALFTFVSLPHRMEYVLTARDLVFINDSKATNVASTIHAISNIKDIYWILGGRPKSGIEDLMKYSTNIKKAYLIGEAMEDFAITLCKYNVNFERSFTLENALNLIKQEATKGSVLLSPACASFDQFLNYEDRGEKFKNIIKTLWK